MYLDRWTEKELSGKYNFINRKNNPTEFIQLVLCYCIFSVDLYFHMNRKESIANSLGCLNGQKKKIFNYNFFLYP